MPQATPASLTPSSGTYGGREGQDLLAEALYVLVLVEAEEAQVDGGVGGVTTLTGVRVDDGGVGGREVIVAAKDPVAALGICGKGRAGDGAGLDVHGDDALGDALGDEGDELRVSGCAALGQEIVEVVAARDVELVNCTVAVGFVAVGEPFLRDERVASSLCQRANTATASAMTSAASTQARRLRTLERE